MIIEIYNTPHQPDTGHLLFKVYDPSHLQMSMGGAIEMPIVKASGDSVLNFERKLTPNDLNKLLNCGSAEFSNKTALFLNQISKGELGPEDENESARIFNTWCLLHAAVTGRSVELKPVNRLPSQTHNPMFRRLAAATSESRATKKVLTDYGTFIVTAYVDEEYYNPDSSSETFTDPVREIEIVISNVKKEDVGLIRERVSVDIFNDNKKLAEYVENLISKRYYDGDDDVELIPVESLERRNMIIESDNINDDISNIIMRKLRPIISKYPDIRVTPGHMLDNPIIRINIEGYAHRGSPIVRLERNVGSEPSGITKLDVMSYSKRDDGPYHNSGVLVRVSKPRYQKDVTTTRELFKIVRLWASGELVVPKRPRQTGQQTGRQMGQQTGRQEAPVVTQVADIDKSDFFPRIAYDSGQAVPGKVVSPGKNFLLKIHAKNVGFPEEIFSRMDLHSQRMTLHPYFIGWIGGTIDGNSMYVNEVQSDLMQRTLELTNQETYNAKMKEMIEKSRGELNDTMRELAYLKQRRSFVSASERFRLVELIQQKQAEIEKLNKNSKRVFALSNYSQYKSKIENTFKQWINAFYHTAFNYARKLGISDIYIISSAKIGDLWGKQSKVEDEASVYARAYDNVANSLSGKLDGDWWHIKLDDIPFREHIDVLCLASLISEDVISEGVDADIIARWMEHAGIDIHNVSGDQTSDFERLDLVITKMKPDGEAVIVKELHSITPDELHRVLSFIERGELDEPEPVDASPEDVDEFMNDAKLAVIASKIIDGVPYGIAVYSMDDPNNQFAYDADSDEDFISDEDLFGLSQDEYDRMNDAWDD